MIRFKNQTNAIIRMPKIINISSNSMNLITKSILVYQKFHLSLILFFLVFIPFNALIQTYTKFQLNLIGIGYLKEVILVLLVGLNFIWILKEKDFGFLKEKIFQFSVFYLVWICLSFFWSEYTTITNFVYGFKYDGLWVIALLIGLTSPSYVREKIQLIILTTIYSFSWALGIGLVLHFIIKPENLSWLGFRNDWSTYYANQALAFCQRIENSELCRFQGTFSGPNQAASNILLLIGLIINYISNFGKKYLLSGLLVLSVVSLFFTYSRSGWLALIVLIGLVLFKKVENKKRVLSIFGLVVVTAVVLISLLMPESIYRYGSNSDRVLRLAEGVGIASESILIGKGLGFSGAASHVRELPVITENWFLQVQINYGLIGFVLFVSLYYMITVKMLQSRKFIIFGFLLIALVIPLNLLHYFEDSSFSYSLFLLLGLFINPKNH